ncbi:hypothetical protein LEP1GSC082_4035 [Leptospira kirschneri str. H2]|uniref:Uncharacterized protein n=1 Tax=Leptospira kirschneri str. H1 TaxID=1049966 RepID=A0A0E2B3X9_9LEPT|nr:hypothetical protein LEP1GSC081_0647 [Leptospira kirschneri str. H1]EKO61626.1 hypothetical protein LEP1GSC082_4035 [Leptospira kirschneri str. H2]
MRILKNSRRGQVMCKKEWANPALPDRAFSSDQQIGGFV